MFLKKLGEDAQMNEDIQQVSQTHDIQSSDGERIQTTQLDEEDLVQITDQKELKANYSKSQLINPR